MTMVMQTGKPTEEITNWSECEIGNLVEATLSGHLAAYEVIIERFQKMAFSHAHKLLNNSQDAQDAVQDAFWEAYQSLSKLRTPEAFPGWFRRIVLKQADRQLRSKFKRRATHALSDIHLSKPDFYVPVADQVSQAAEKQIIHTGIASLPDRQSQVVSLHYIDGLSQKEISLFLELPISTIKKRLHDARINLKRQLNLMNTETNTSQLKDSKAQLILFYIALRANDLTTIKKQLKAQPDLVNVLSEWPVASDTYYWPLGVTPLNWAAGVGNIELARILIEHGATINGLDGERYAPLHHAIKMGQLEMVHYLLETGADYQQVAQNGLTPLHFAILYEELQIAEILIEAGTDPTVKDKFDHSAVNWAQAKGLEEFGQLLQFQLAANEKPEAIKPPNHHLEIPNVSSLLGRTINSQGQPIDKRPLRSDTKLSIPKSAVQTKVLETGIKMIDLCMPIKRGGFSAVFTPLSGVGRLLIQAQLMHSMIKNYDGYVVYLGVERGENTANALKMEWQAEFNIPQKMLEERFILVFEQEDSSESTKQQLAVTGRKIAEELWLQGKEVLLVAEYMISQIEGAIDHLRQHSSVSSQAAITTIFDGDYTVGLEPSPLSDLDSVITFSYSRAHAGLWPAIDPIASQINPNWLAQLPSNHKQMTIQARQLLHRYTGLELQYEKQGEAGLFYLSDAAQEVRYAIRGQRLNQFLTQILPVNESRTGRLGQLVPLDKTVAGAESIIQGKLDLVDKAKLTFVGGL